MLGDLLMQSSKSEQANKKSAKAAELKADATKQYAKAGEAAGLDPGPHQQLVVRFKQIGRPDLAAREQQWLADYETKRKLIEAQRAKSGQVPLRTPGGGP